MVRDLVGEEQREADAGGGQLGEGGNMAHVSA